jgi:hypothetical protein
MEEDTDKGARLVSETRREKRCRWLGPIMEEDTDKGALLACRTL